jgi:hypothetical protein
MQADATGGAVGIGAVAKAVNLQVKMVTQTGIELAASIG